MAFPTIPTSAAGRILNTANTAGGATKTFPNLSSLTKNPGDLLIAVAVTYDGNSTNAEFSAWGAGFTEFVDQTTTTTMGIGAAYKWSDGTETGTFTVTTADTSTNDSQLLLMSIPGVSGTTPPEGGTIINGTAAAADIASLNPAGWGTEDTLWIAVCGSGEDATTGTFDAPTVAPTNYGNLFVTTVSADVVGGVYAALAFRQLNAASDDPATFTVDLSNARNSALLIAVRPSPVGDPYQRDPENYRANIFFRPSSEAFQTLGDATSPSDVTPITLTDTGAGDDSLTASAAVPLDDAGTGTDSISVSVDTGIDPNQARPQVAWMFTQPNAASFQLQGDAFASPITPITLTDTGAASDALTVAAAVPLSDTAAGSDAVTVTAAVPLTDTGSSSDAVTVAADVPLTDTATGADSISVQVSGQPDPYQAWPQNFPAFTAPFVEPVAKPFQLLGDASGVVQVSLTDTGAGADAITVTVTLPLSDTAAGTDSLSVAATVPLADTAVGSDGVALTAAVPLTDTAVGDDALSVFVSTIIDPNQAPPQRFGWALLQPQWVEPFQLLGDATTPPTAVTPKAGRITPGARAFAGIAGGTRQGAQAEPGTRTGPSVEGGG